MKHLYLKCFFLVIFSFLGFKAEAYDCKVDRIYYNLNNTDNTASVTYLYKNSTSNKSAYSGSVTIPSSITYNGTTYSVTSIGSSAFLYCSNLTSISIPNSVTSIGGAAFSGCSGLTYVTIPSSVTSIGRYGFWECKGLKKVIVNDIAAWCKIYVQESSDNPLSYAHHLYSDENTEITELVIPNSVASISDYAFYGCSALTSLTIPNSVTSIGGNAFYGCSALTSVTIPNSVTSIGGNAFHACPGMTEVNINSNAIVSAKRTTTTSLSTLFGSQVKSYVIGNSVTSIGNSAFYGCNKLTSVNIGNSVTSVGNAAFSGCYGLTSITIGSSVTSFGTYAFYDCTALTEVTINSNSVVSKDRTSSSSLSTIFGNQVISYVIGNSVTSIGSSAFQGCSGMTSITIPNSVTSIGSSAFSGCKGLTSITIPNSVTSIGSSAFSSCTGLTSITFPNSVATIGESAFNSCTGLTTVTIGNSMTSIGSSAFSGCTGLKKVILSDMTTWCKIAFANSSSNPLYYAHHLYSDENTEITELVIPNGVTSIGGNAFYGCTALTSVTIPNSVTSIGSSAFYECNGLKKVISNDMTAWCKIVFANSSSNPLYYAHHLFSDANTEIAKLVIPNGVTKIGGNAFYGCTGLTSVYIPNSVTSIGGNAFSGCTGLTDVTINSNSIASSNRTSSSSLSTVFGNQVKSYVIGSSVTTIGSNAFYNCSGLTSVTIGSGVTTIGMDAFYGCSSLSAVLINNQDKWLGISFNNATANPLYYAHNLYLYIELDFMDNIKIPLSDFNVSENVTSIKDYAFVGFSGMTDIMISNSVTSIGNHAFQGCSGLTSVTIPNSVTSIGSSTFQDCSGLGYFTIGNSVNSIGENAFSGCTSLTEVSINSNSIVSSNRTSSTSLLTVFGNQVKSYIIGNSVTSIGSSAFYGCSGLTSITFPNSVTSIGSSAFYGCSGLTSITIPNSVTSIGSSAFQNCNGLKKVISSDMTAWCKIVFTNSLSNPLYYAHHLFSDANTEITELIIPNDVASIGSNAFYGCTGLTYVDIPSSVTSIGGSAFSGCTGLTYVDIPSSVTSIGGSAFSGCTGLTKVTINSNSIVSSNRTSGTSLSTVFGNQVKSYVIGNSVTSIGDNAFYGCAGMTSVTIPNSVTSIGSSAFYGCSGLTSITIPNSVTSIGSSAFQNCNGLKKVISSDMTAWCKITFANSSSNPLYNAHHLFSDANTEITELVIPNGVASIGDNAFYGCTGLTSVDIPSSVTSIGGNAFSGCTELTEVSINSNSIVSSNRTSSTSLSTVFGNQVKSYVIGNSVTSIGSNAFYGCAGMTSVTIPNSVTSIGSSAFCNCSGLTSITIPSSLTNIGSSAFQGCNGLKKVITKDIAAWCKVNFSTEYSNPLYYAHHLFSDDNTEITNLVIPNSVTSIEKYAFYGCTGLTSVTIPNSVTSIGNSTFRSCSSLISVTIGNNVTSIGDYAFSGCNAKLYVNKGTKSLITLWNKSLSAYDIESGLILPPPYISLTSATQTSITVTVVNYYDGYTYTINNVTINKGESKTFSGMRPDDSKYLTLRVALDDISYNKGQSFSSKGINLKINTTTTSSSISVVGSYTHGDAVVTNEEIYVGGKKVFDKNKGVICGLDPNTAYIIKYSTNFGSISETVRTAPLTLTTSQPKVISAGNVIVAAESNLDDEETKVGFEWRRIDYTDEFPSNTGTAYLYNGTMEGYIRNLNTEKLWKYRPYYTSDAGNTYYGEWVGIDPTNTSYFEPTVHTYANVSVNGNSAEVKGYVQRGTDNVVSKGFAYWEQSQGVKSREAMSVPSKISSLPSNAKIVEISGSQQVMTASISDLEYETTYCYVAFVKTSEGDTFYGEEMTFTSGESPYTLGDVNGDKQIDISDVVAMVNYILGSTSSTSFKPQAADINKDGNIDISDVVSLVNIILAQ